mgnify:FL=1
MTKSNKGFTLIEMIIVLAVTAIIFAIITGLMVTVTKTQAKEEAVTDAMEELNAVSEMAKLWVASYDTEEAYFSQDGDSNAIAIRQGADGELIDRRLYFDEDAGCAIAECKAETKEYTCTRIKDIDVNWDAENNIIETVISYSISSYDDEELSTYTVLYAVRTENDRKA